MRGYLPTICDPQNENRYSDLTVLKSAAGWYIGTLYANEDGYDEPGSRESGYYAIEGEADIALATNSWDQRMHP
jgi:hypothetical protein